MLRCSYAPLVINVQETSLVAMESVGKKLEGSCSTCPNNQLRIEK